MKAVEHVRFMSRPGTVGILEGMLPVPGSVVLLGGASRRLAVILPVLVTALLSGALAAQGAFSAQLVAQMPIVAEWLNAPPNTPGAIVSHPAGPLTSAAVSVNAGLGTNSASFSCVAVAGSSPEVRIHAAAWAPATEQVETRADLLLSIQAPMDRRGDLQVELTAMGDDGVPTAFLLDIGNDGTVELDAWPYSSSFERWRTFHWDFSAGPLLVRILHTGTHGALPQDYRLDLRFEPWVAQSTDLGSSCNFGMPVWMPSVWSLNDHLGALLPNSAQALCRMSARGRGNFAAFLVSDRQDLVPAPLPSAWGRLCNMLDRVVLVEPGVVTGTSQGADFQWAADIPLLPPGIEFYVQHVSLDPGYQAGLAYWLTNRVRIRT